jgi:hypothetical protein
MFFRLMLVVMVLFMAGRVDAAGDAFDVRDLGEQGRVVYLVAGGGGPGRA